MLVASASVCVCMCVCMRACGRAGVRAWHACHVRVRVCLSVYLCIIKNLSEFVRLLASRVLEIS